MFTAGCAFIIPVGTQEQNHYTIILNDAENDMEAALVTLTSQPLFYQTYVFPAGSRIFGNQQKLVKDSYVCCHRVRIESTFEIRELAQYSHFTHLGYVSQAILQTLRETVASSNATPPEILRKLGELGLIPEE